MRKLRKIIIFLFMWAFLVNTSVLAVTEEDFSTEPTKNNGKKWRIGYYEGGEWPDYQKNLVAMVKALMEMGWIEPMEIPEQKEAQTVEFWKWLATEAKSEYLEFIEDAHYTANWDDALSDKMAAEIIERFNQKKDIDLMLALGTRAGKDLANDKHTTPTMVLSASNPLKAGIIKSIDDSGYDYLHARISPGKNERQIRIFHDIIGFQKLGVAYENTDTGKTYAAVDTIEMVAAELGFEFVSCYTKGDIPDVKLAEETVKQCFKELGEKGVDALYVTTQNGINPDSITELVEIVNSYRIPTFSQHGSKDVKSGFLMSISRVDFMPLGRFEATVLSRIFNGANPRQLDQVFESPPKIAINLKTAEIIDYDPPVDVLGAADEIYQEIEKPE